MVTPLSVIKVVISWAIQNVFVRRIICPCLYRMRSKRFCAEDRGFLSEAGQFPFGFASWAKRRSKRFLCGGSRLPFGSGAIPFRVCKLAKRRSKRFCAEDRGFLSEAKQFPVGKPLNAPRVHQECTESAPGVHQECTRSAPEVHQK